MVDDGDVTRYEFVFEDGTIGQIDARTLIGDNDDGSTKSDVTSEPNIARNCQVIQLKEVGHSAEPLLEVNELLESVAEFNDGSLGEHAVGVHDELAVLKAVKIAGNQKQIGAALDRQEARSRNVDTMSTLEVLDGSTDGSLELDDWLAIIRNLVVDDDIKFHSTAVHYAFERMEVNVHRVGVEVLELPNRLEVLDVLRRHLSDFEQADSALVIDDGTTLDVSLCLIGKLHEELSIGLAEMVEDAEIDIGTEIVNVGDEEVILSGIDKAVEKARVGERVEDVTVTGRVPFALVAVGAPGNRQ